jgi:hypothetical protein
VAYGTWTFNRNGTGTAGGTNFAMDFPPGHPTLGPRARNNPFFLEFNYDVMNDGMITITVTNLPNITYNIEGQVSQDRKTITLYNAYTFLGPTSIFMASRVLIKIGDNKEED